MPTNYFMKKSTFKKGAFNSGFLKDKEDVRDYKFSDIVKEKIKIVKTTVKKSVVKKRGTYRKPDYYKSILSKTIYKTIEAAESIPAKLDHTENMSPVKNQGQLGSCVAFAAVAIKEYQEKIEHEREVQAGKKDHRKGKIYDYSEQWVYWNCKKIDGYPGEGTYLRTAMRVLQKIGVPTEKAWPYSESNVDIGEPKKWADLIARWAIIDSYWSISNSLELKIALNDSPVIIGVPVFDEWAMPIGGVIDYPANPDNQLGGHAVCAVGYDDSTQLIKFKNSWSKYWGDRGYGYLPYKYIDDFMWSAWATKDVTVTRDMIKGVRELIG